MNWGDSRLPERFWNKVAPCPMSGCWLWTGTTQNGDYGTVKHDGRTRLAHRVSFLTLVGAIAPGLHLDHLCRVRCCVNPSHLEPVTPGENTRRSTAPQAAVARHAAVTHCPQGHPYDENNTVRWQNARRRHRLCRICLRTAQREHMRRKRAALREARKAA